MSASEPLKRYTCDRCHIVTYAALSQLPAYWLSLSIHSESRLGRITHLCQSCRNDLDKHLHPSTP